MLSSKASSRTVASRASSSRSVCRFASLPHPTLIKRQNFTTSRQVTVNLFKFGKNGFGAEAAGIMGSQGRDEYSMDDVEAYFNYMGFLAEEGTYDRMYKLCEGRHPIDVILLLAASQNDTPKIGEILGAGADVTVKDPDGKVAMDLATKEETKALLKAKAQV